MLKLTEEFLNKGKVWIPDCSRDDLPKFFKELGFKTGLEVGVDEGVFTKKFCEEGIKMYGVDPWSSYYDYHDKPSFDKCTELIYQKAKKNLEGYDCTIIRKTSMDAMPDIPDRSLDFVYIDGNHSFGHVAYDLMGWSKKVKKGGVISGHDYYCVEPKYKRVVRQVGFAVDAFVKSYDIENWYILGEPQGKNDGWLSYIIFKNW